MFGDIHMLAMKISFVVCRQQQQQQQQDQSSTPSSKSLISLLVDERYSIC